MMFSTYRQRNVTEEDEMGGEFSMHRVDEKLTQTFVGKPEEKVA
jgi:hypothetical protein